MIANGGVADPLRGGGVVARRAHPLAVVGTDKPSRSWLGWFALAVVAALPVAEGVRIVVQHQSVVLDGDEALFDLGARRAGDLLQLVGPYSRVGFHEPGPAVFYLLAPFARLLGSDGAGLFLGAVVVSGTALVASVAVLWRLAGPAVALWVAAMIDLYCLCLQVGTLREPWNPYLVVTPMVLFVILWCAAMTRAPGAGVWALAIGSYEVQTHVATAGFVVSMMAILVGRATVSAWRAKGPRADRRRGWGPARTAGTIAVCLVWVPSTIELWRDHPNNVALLWRSLASSHTGASVHQALTVAANALTIMPWGYHDYVLTSTRSPAQIVFAALLMAVGLLVALCLGVQRRQPMSLALSASAVLGVVVGAISLFLAPAPLYLYFAVWMAFVPLSILLAIGVALFAPAAMPRSHAATLGPRHRYALGSVTARRRQAAGAIAIVAIVGIAAITVRSDLLMAPIDTTAGAGPWPQKIDTSLRQRSAAPRDTAALSAAAARVLTPADRRVGFDMSATTPWPYVAGIVLALDERGVQATVAPTIWELYFGHERAPGPPVTVQFELFAAAVPASERPRAATTIAVVDGFVLAYRRLPPR